ncbi:MAG: hypothetical protein MK132_07460 [Lentisphaerales bacterium]|nr:hypothetical protein [Lentisphaerales bacterium]
MHSDFPVIHFKDSGRSADTPHPHAMELYQRVMLEQTPRLKTLLATSSFVSQ